MSLMSEEAPPLEEDDLTRFLLNPENGHPSVEQRLDDLARSELEALDRYLTAEAGAGWTEAKEVHSFSIRDGSWRTLWPGRVASRLLLSEKERSNLGWAQVLCNGTKPLQLKHFDVPKAGPIAIVVSGGFLDVELIRSYHPEITKSRLFSETPEPDRVAELVERYCLALRLLDKHDQKGFAVFANSVSAIVPLQLDPPLEPGKCVSLSIAAAPGVVLLTMIPIILLSETLLHEAAHCRLSAAESLAKLWKSSGVRIESPLRPDPRPIAGLYHQTYVLYWLSRYYNLLRHATQESVVQRNLRQIDKRIDELSTGFRGAISALRANQVELTLLGTRLVEEMALAGAVT